MAGAEVSHRVFLSHPALPPLVCAAHLTQIHTPTPGHPRPTGETLTPTAIASTIQSVFIMDAVKCLILSTGTYQDHSP